jgi:biotin-(acetyl-CoA carboxylase) ligase
LYNKFLEDGFLLIKDDYIRRAGFLKQEVTVRLPDKDVSGIAEGVTDTGALILKDKNNKEHILLIGDIL